MVRTGKHFLTTLIGLICFASTAIAQVNTPQILLPGTFHGNEVVAQTGEEWLAMVPFDRGYTLVETRVRIDLVRDELQDNDNQTTGKRVSVDIDKKKSLFLLRGISSVKPGEIETIAAKTIPLEINKSIQLRLKSKRTYKLSVVCEETTPLTVDNFKECSLILTIGSKSQRIMTFTVYYPPNNKPIFASDAHPSLLWAGDIDRDGALDLLLDLSNHYNISNPTLFLSSDAQNNDLVIKKTEFITYGD
jgi:hypothetical protein